MEKCLPSTETAIIAIAKADPCFTPESIMELRAFLKGNAGTKPATATRLVRRREIQERTGLSFASIDRYAAMGYLKRVALGNSTRASGFTAESVEAFIAGAAKEKGVANV